jgi:RHS repeat-associated protein
VTDGENNKTTYVYDGMNRLQKVQYPSPTKGAGTSSTTDYEQYGYDPNGNVISVRLRDGTSIAYAYDNLNRMTSKDLPGTEATVTYTYDLLNRPLSATQGSLVLTNGYDQLGRLLSQSQPYGTMTYQYDAAGQRIKATWGDGFYVNYDYLVSGDVSKIRENGATTGVGVLATYGYNNLGSMTSITRGNGTVTNYTPDAVSRLSQLVQDLSGTSSDQMIGFSYNPASEITAVTHSNDAYAWSGHVDVIRNYTSNGLNQYTVGGPASYAYDGRGNLTGDGTNTYTYTSENRLATKNGGLSFTYDPMGRLAQYNAPASTRFVYDGAHMASEVSTTGTLLRRYVFGPGSDSPLVWYEGSGTTDRRWLHADERGSIIAVTNGSGVPITGGILSYDEYGIPATANAGRFQYTGQAWLPEAGLAYYKARMYSPTLGRFMQTDPIGYGDGLNWYAYAKNDPVNLTDPTGNACLELTWNHMVFTNGQFNDGRSFQVPLGFVCSDDGLAQSQGLDPSREAQQNVLAQYQIVVSGRRKTQSKACEILERNADKGLQDLPKRVTDSWSDVGWLKEYRREYQRNADQWAFLASKPVSYAVLLLSLTPAGRAWTAGAKAAGVAGAFLAGGGNIEVSDFIKDQLEWNRKNVQMIDARLDQLEGGC